MDFPQLRQQQQQQRHRHPFSTLLILPSFLLLLPPSLVDASCHTTVPNVPCSGQGECVPYNTTIFNATSSNTTGSVDTHYCSCYPYLEGDTVWFNFGNNDCVLNFLALQVVCIVSAVLHLIGLCLLISRFVSFKMLQRETDDAELGGVSDEKSSSFLFQVISLFILNAYALVVAVLYANRVFPVNDWGCAVFIGIYLLVFIPRQLVQTRQFFEAFYTHERVSRFLSTMIHAYASIGGAFSVSHFVLTLLLRWTRDPEIQLYIIRAMMASDAVWMFINGRLRVYYLTGVIRLFKENESNITLSESLNLLKFHRTTDNRKTIIMVIFLTVSAVIPMIEPYMRIFVALVCLGEISRLTRVFNVTERRLTRTITERSAANSITDQTSVAEKKTLTT